MSGVLNQEEEKKFAESWNRSQELRAAANRIDDLRENIERSLRSGSTASQRRYLFALLDRELESGAERP